VSRIRRAGAETIANAACGDIAARKYATCVVEATRPRTSSDSGAVSETTAVATVDCPTNERIARRSAPSGTAGSCGNRRYAIQPATLTAAVATTCAITIAAIVLLSPYGAATAIAVNRSAIDTKRKNARRS
jgi:hypothetical protein